MSLWLDKCYISELCSWLRDHKYWKEANWFENNGEDIIIVRTTQAVNLLKFIHSRFTWDCTPQGSAFWHKIFKEMKREDADRHSFEVHSSIEKGDRKSIDYSVAYDKYRADLQALNVS